MMHRQSLAAGACLLMLVSAWPVAQADVLPLKWVDLHRSSISASDGNMEAVALNDNGQAAGRTWRVSTVYNKTTRTWTSVTTYTPVRWSHAGAPTSLSSAGTAQVTDIAADGTVVGSEAGQAARWINGVLNTLPSASGGQAAAVNAAGTIVGQIDTDNALHTGLQRHAASWSNGALTDLHGLLPFRNVIMESRALGVSADGSIAVNLTYPLVVNPDRSCYLIRGGAALPLMAPTALGCQIDAMARDGSALVTQVLPHDCASTTAGTACSPVVATKTWWRQGGLLNLSDVAPAAQFKLLRSGLLLKLDANGVARVNADASVTPLQFNVSGLPTGYQVSDYIDSNVKGQFLVKLTKTGSAGQSHRWGLLVPQ